MSKSFTSESFTKRFICKYLIERCQKPLTLFHGISWFDWEIVSGDNRPRTPGTIVSMKSSRLQSTGEINLFELSSLIYIPFHNYCLEYYVILLYFFRGGMLRPIKGLWPVSIFQLIEFFQTNFMILNRTSYLVIYR